MTLKDRFAQDHVYVYPSEPTHERLSLLSVRS